MKEAIQAGVERIVYKNWYPAKYSEPLKQQYRELVAHLTNGDATRFEGLGGGGGLFVEDAPPDAYEASPPEDEGLKPSDL